MLSRTFTFWPRLLSRLPRAAAYGARIYLALVVIQFVFGFLVGAGSVMFDYDLDFVSSFLSADD
jgi:hypothetical protein